MAILFVSHFLDQVYEIADRMTVLRNGRLVGEYLPEEMDRLALLSPCSAGNSVFWTRSSNARRNEPRLRSGPDRQNLSVQGPLNLRPGDPCGEVGLAGLLGSGRTELARLLFGADHADSGSILANGHPIRPRGARSMIAHGVAFCSEDRKAEGVVADLTVRDNLVLALQAARGWARPVPRRTADSLVAEYIEKLDIRPADPGAIMGNLSGGNQQKVLLARWLITRPALLILDEPTRGIDVGAKAQIQKIVAELAADGMAVLFISSELEEVIRVSDRVVVLRDRRKVAELSGTEATVDDVMATIAAHGEQETAVAS